MFDKMFWKEIGRGCKQPIPDWIKKAERRGRSRLATYHGIPYDTEVTFKGKKYLYKVVYGPLDNGQGVSADVKFYRKQRTQVRKSYRTKRKISVVNEMLGLLPGVGGGVGTYR